MSNSAKHHHITYIEFFATDIERAKQFYSKAFGWSFKDWGSDYTCFTGAGIEGGFSRKEPHEAQKKSSPLMVIYSKDLEATQAAIEAAGGNIAVPIFSFPGGRRFHFTDGVGNLLGVWSE